METQRRRQQGLMSSLKSDVPRSLSPARAGSISCLLRRMKSLPAASDEKEKESRVGRSGSLRALEPLREGPDPDGGKEVGGLKKVGSGLSGWVKGQLGKAPSFGAGTGEDLRLLLGVLGAPLAPVEVPEVEDGGSVGQLGTKDAPIESLSAHYILQQYTAASGGDKLLNSVRNAYTLGKVRMLASSFETGAGVKKTRNNARDAQSGGFVLWQMNQGKWYVELVVGDSKVHAGCDGKLVWRHTSWLGAHPAKGPIRPLRRALQGLDPRTTAAIFANARCVGEKKINGDDCFILKLCADPETLKDRSDGPAEIIRHTLLGYFSQRTGLLVHLEDSHLTRIQTVGGEAVYWETTINSFLDDYKGVEGIMIAHSGRSSVSLFKFGETVMSHTKTKMEEAWTIEEVAFNVPGLSDDCFIPPSDIRSRSISEACLLPRDQSSKGSSSFATHGAKISALEKEEAEKTTELIGH